MNSTSSTAPETIQDFLERHADLLSQKDWSWRRILRGIVRRSTNAEGLRLQLVELVDEEKRPNVHPAIRAKALSLLLAPNLNWFAEHPVHADLINARRPLAGWLSDIANINWMKVPLELRPLTKELILISWDLIPRRTDTVRHEEYSRHLLEYASLTLGQECEELVNMCPLEYLGDSYLCFLSNRWIEVDDKFRINKIIQTRVNKDTAKIQQLFIAVMKSVERLRERYPKPLLAEQLIFLLKYGSIDTGLLDLTMIRNLFSCLSIRNERNICLRLVTTFVETHLEGKLTPFPVHGLADLETLRAMKRVAEPEYSRLAQQIGRIIEKVEKALSPCTCSTGACACQTDLVVRPVIKQEPAIH